MKLTVNDADVELGGVHAKSPLSSVPREVLGSRGPDPELRGREALAPVFGARSLSSQPEKHACPTGFRSFG